MGSVYEGEHSATGRLVAIKLVHLKSPASTELEERFEREARIASNVQSKHIVQVFDAGRDDELGPFMVMELLRGEDLEARLARLGALPPRMACEIAFQAARGLEKAHAANVAHRDLKPGNIFLVDSDEEDFLVKVLDFGIAKLWGEDSELSAKLTREGSTLGTPQYMSPEQARGRTDIDARTDVYSLGSVLYEMIVGRSHVPELANYNQLVIHIATEPAPRLSSSVPDIDPRIDLLVADMLIGDRRDRIQTMRMVRERISSILGTGVRSGSMADASGSFPAGRAAPSAAFSSARLVSAMPSAEASPSADDDSEEVHFFERESRSTQAAAPAFPDPEPAPPDSESEAVALFDRASLRIPLERTSSGAHVVDRIPSAAPPPQRVEIISSSPPRPLPAPAPPPKRPRRTVLAAAASALALVLLGSIRLVTGSSTPSAPPAVARPPEPLPSSVVSPPEPAPSRAHPDAGTTIPSTPMP
jgi:serine/threonine-protein kinase